MPMFDSATISWLFILLLCRKHRGRDTNTDIYGYRNGSYLEAKELCMALAGQEHTLGPRRGVSPIMLIIIESKSEGNDDWALLG